MPGNRQWINDGGDGFHSGYEFGGVANPGSERAPTPKSGGKKNVANNPFPPPSWGQKKESGSYFESEFSDEFESPKRWNTGRDTDPFSVANFGTQFESDFYPDEPQIRSNYHDRRPLSRGSTSRDDIIASGSRFSPRNTVHSRSMSVANTFASDEGQSYVATHQRSVSLAPPPYKPELTTPLPQDGVARAIALYNFQAVEVCDLPYTWLVDQY
jgi:hypothetical protein